MTTNRFVGIIIILISELQHIKKRAMNENPTIKRFQSAITGEFVTKEYARLHSRTTFLHIIMVATASKKEAIATANQLMVSV